MGNTDLYLGFQERKFSKTRTSFKYVEDSNTFFEVSLHQSKIDEFSEIAYISWIQGKGSGIRLLGYILNKLHRRSKDNNIPIQIFIEPTTIECSRFIEKLMRLGLKLRKEDSQINSGCKGYVLEVNHEALNVLAGEA